MENIKKLVIGNLQREKYTSKNDNKQYFRYFVIVTIKGRLFKTIMLPQDLDGYALLDVIFDGNETAPLYYESKEITINDKVISQDLYSVLTHDTELDIDIECPIKPATSIDDNGHKNGVTCKSLLSILVQFAQKQIKKIDNKKE